MINTNISTQRIFGAEKIKSYCAMYLFNLGINLDFIDWSTNVLNETNEYVLVMNNGHWDIELKFDSKELVNYSRNRGIRKIEQKLNSSLMRFIENTSDNKV